MIGIFTPSLASRSLLSSEFNVSRTWAQEPGSNQSRFSSHCYIYAMLWHYNATKMLHDSEYYLIQNPGMNCSQILNPLYSSAVRLVGVVAFIEGFKV